MPGTLADILRHVLLPGLFHGRLPIAGPGRLRLPQRLTLAGKLRDTGPYIPDDGRLLAGLDGIDNAKRTLLTGKFRRLPIARSNADICSRTPLRTKPGNRNAFPVVSRRMRRRFRNLAVHVVIMLHRLFHGATPHPTPMRLL